MKNRRWLPVVCFLIVSPLLSSSTFSTSPAISQSWFSRIKTYFEYKPKTSNYFANVCSDTTRPNIVNESSDPKLQTDPFAPGSPWILVPLTVQPTHKSIKIKFDKVMSIASINSDTIKMYEGYMEDQDKLVDTKIKYTISDNIVTITPVDKLKYTTNYSLHIGGEKEYIDIKEANVWYTSVAPAVKDLCGNLLLYKTAINFTTFDSEFVQELIKNPSLANIKTVMEEIAVLAPEFPSLWNGLLNIQNVGLNLLEPQSRVDETIKFLSLVAIATGKIPEKTNASADSAARFLSAALEFNVWPNAITMDPITNSPGQLIVYELFNFARIESKNFKYAKQPNEVKVASIQFDSGFADTMEKVEKNIDALSKLATTAAMAGAMFIVTPEIAIHGYADVDFTKPPTGDSDYYYDQFFYKKGLQRLWCHDSREAGCSSGKVSGEPSDYSSKLVPLVDASPVALTYDDDKLKIFSDIAKTYKVYISIGYIEKKGTGDEQKLYNSVNVYGPSGQLAYHYRKTYLFPDVDKFIFTPGTLSSAPYFDTPYGRISAAICYDHKYIFPELAKFNVNTLLYSVGWVTGGPFYGGGVNYGYLSSHVHDYPMNIVEANWVWKDKQNEILGENAEIWGSGLSYIMDKWGGIKGIVTYNADADILYGTIPY